MKKKILAILIPSLFVITGCLSHVQEDGNPRATGYDPDLDGPSRSNEHDGRRAPVQVPRVQEDARPPVRYRRSRRRRRIALKMSRRYHARMRKYSAKMNKLRFQMVRWTQRVRWWRSQAVQLGYYTPHHYRLISRAQSRIWRLRRAILQLNFRIHSLRARYATRYGHLPQTQTYAMRGNPGFAAPPPGWRAPMPGDQTPAPPKKTIPEDPSFPSTPPPGAGTPAAPAPSTGNGMFPTTPPPSNGGMFPSTPPPSGSEPDQAPPAEPGTAPAPTAIKGIGAWRSYCTAEKKRYPVGPYPRFAKTQELRSGQSIWSVKAYNYGGGQSIVPIHSLKGRFAFLGLGGRFSQAHCADRPFYLWDNKSRRILSLRPPLTRFLLGNRRFLPWFQGAKYAPVQVTLLHYNPNHHQAGILLRASISASQTRRYRFAYLQWDLRRRQIVRSWELGRAACAGTYRAVGVSPDNNTFYFLQRGESDGTCQEVEKARAASKGQRQRLSLLKIDIQSGQRQRVASITHRYKIESVVPNPSFSQFAISEYTELDNDRGRVYLVSASTGRVQRHAIPHVPYGVTFSPDEKRLLVYGSKRGELLQLTLANGARASHNTYRRGHAIGFSSDGRWLYLLFHSGIEVRDAQSLKRVAFTSHRKMMGNVKFLHVDGSAIGGGSVLIKNENQVYVQSISQFSKKAGKNNTAKNAAYRKKLKGYLTTL